MAKLQKFLRIFDSAGINALIDKKAADFNSVKTYRDEMKTGFIVFWALGIFANIVSMASAWYHFHGLLEVIITNRYLLGAVTLLLLVLLELATVWLIYKAVKFSLHGKVSVAAVFIFFAVVAFAANFYTSTNGLKDKSREILSEKQQIRKQYSSDSLQLEARIVPAIDSLTYANSLLTRKTTLQNTTMFAANAQSIKDMRTELTSERKALRMRKDAALSKDEIHAESRSDIYWKTVVVVQIILCVSYVFTGFYYHKTNEQQKNTETVIGEFVSTMRTTSNAAISELMQTAFGNYTSALMHEADREFNLHKPIPFEALDTTTQEEEPTTDTKTKIIGFSMQKKDATTDENPRDHQNVLNATKNVQSEKPDANDNAKSIERIEKHATLVRYIIENTAPTDDTISNSIVEQIQNEADTAKQKGRTLIRELFVITKAVGREHIQEILKQ